MCEGSLTLHQSAKPPGPENITVFIIATTQGKKCVKPTSGILSLCKNMNIFKELSNHILLNMNHFGYLSEFGLM